MALIPKFFVVSTELPVGATAIDMGMLVKVDTSGDIVPYNGSGTVLGLAGDTLSTSASAMPGIYSGWQNRVTDSFNETAASAKMTVYYGGGEFATDQFESDVLTADTGVSLYGSSNGLLQASVSGSAIAILTKAAGPYPSGVPGVDVNGDMALKGANTNQYIEIKLLV